MLTWGKSNPAVASGSLSEPFGSWVCARQRFPEGKWQWPPSPARSACNHLGAPRLVVQKLSCRPVRAHTSFVSSTAMTGGCVPVLEVRSRNSPRPWEKLTWSFSTAAWRRSRFASPVANLWGAGEFLDPSSWLQSAGWSREIKPHMLEHLLKHRDLAGKEGGVAEHSGRGVSMRPLVYSQRVRMVRRTAAGSTGQGLGQGWGPIATAHQEQLSQRGIQFSV